MPRRTHGLVLPILSLALLASACGDSDDPGDERASKPEQAATETEAATTGKPSGEPASGSTTSPDEDKPSSGEESTKKSEGDSSSDASDDGNAKPGSRDLSKKEKKQRAEEQQGKQRAEKARDRRQASPDRSRSRGPSTRLAPSSPNPTGPIARCLRRAKTNLRAQARCLKISVRELNRLTYEGCLVLARRSDNPSRARQRCRAQYRRAQARARR